MNQTALSFKIDSQLKKDFSVICEDFGMPVSTAFIIFAKTVVREHRIPFEIRSDIPNETTRRTIELAEENKELHGPFSTISQLRTSLDA